MTLSTSPSNQRLAVFLLFILCSYCQGWVLPSKTFTQQLTLWSTTDDSSTLAATSQEDDSGSDDEDDDDEYEYVEYDILTEPEFSGSEWLVGTVMDNNPSKIVETWARLAIDKDGKNVAIWGDDSQGTWSFDVASQFLSFSKENIFGKNIWAGVVDDYYYTQGTVRGWSFLTSAAVLGQWQARRLGVDKDEAGIAPWFQEPEEEEGGEDGDTKELPAAESESESDE